MHELVTKLSQFNNRLRMEKTRMENTKKLKFDFNDLQVNDWIAALENAPASPKKMTVREVLASKEISLALAKARDRGLSNEAAAAALNATGLPVSARHIAAELRSKRSITKHPKVQKVVQ